MVGEKPRPSHSWSTVSHAYPNTPANPVPEDHAVSVAAPTPLPPPPLVLARVPPAAKLGGSR